jgi:hypothetical protein
MKFISYILLGVIFFTILLNPFIELLSEFNDKTRIGSAMKVSCRNAVLTSANENVLRDVEGEVKRDDFVEDFIDNFCISLNLKQRNGILESSDGRYNDFKVDISWIDKNECEIVVKTYYKFKTPLFKRFLGDSSNSSPVEIVLKRRQLLKAEN